MVILPVVEGGDLGEGALMAVPGEHLAQVSVASAYGTLTVAVAPGR